MIGPSFRCAEANDGKRGGEWRRVHCVNHLGQAANHTHSIWPIIRGVGSSYLKPGLQLNGDGRGMLGEKAARWLALVHGRLGRPINRWSKKDGGL